MLALLQQRWWCPMCDGGWGWSMMLVMTLFWIVVIALVVWLIYRLSAGARGPTGGAADLGKAEEILRQRYARGEIDRDTYQRMLEDLRR